jgi:hypothetical protein
MINRCNPYQDWTAMVSSASKQLAGQSTSSSIGSSYSGQIVRSPIL